MLRLCCGNDVTLAGGTSWDCDAEGRLRISANVLLLTLKRRSLAARRGTPFSDWMCRLPSERHENKLLVRVSVRTRVLGMATLALMAG